jgi:hypothetical protein
MATLRIVRPASVAGAVAQVAVAVPVDGAVSPVPPTVVITASSTERETPSPRVVAFSFGLLLVGTLFALGLDIANQLPPVLSLADNMNAFALFYVAAQGIERLLEPFTYYIKPTQPTEDTLDEKKGTALTAAMAEATTAAGEAVNAKAKLARLQSERSILFWAISSVIGIGASAWLGLHFIAMVLSQASQASVPAWLDVTITGLVIGGGTKALHDLIGRISKPAPDTDGAAGS